jgi:multidrug efflux pump subunit AcrA (membrane-fusion protein)
MGRQRLSTACLALIATLAAASCGPGAQPEAEPIRPVRVVTVEKREGGETVSLTGRIQAEDNVSLSFRVGGRMVARTVNVGDRVEAGQVIARIEPDQAENALRAARANLAAAMSVLTKTRNDFGLQDQLLRDGWTTRVRHDQALQAFQSAQAQVDAQRRLGPLFPSSPDYVLTSLDKLGMLDRGDEDMVNIVIGANRFRRAAQKVSSDWPENLRTNAAVIADLGLETVTEAMNHLDSGMPAQWVYTFLSGAASNETLTKALSRVADAQPGEDA